MSVPKEDFASMVQDLLNAQQEITNYNNPAFNNTWGYLAAQGKALLAGSYASMTQGEWEQQYHTFLTQMTGVNPTHTFIQAVQDEGWDGAGAAVSDSVAHLPATVGTAVVNAGQTIGTAVGATAAGAIDAVAPALPSIPWLWIALGVGAIVFVPMLLGEKK